MQDDKAADEAYDEYEDSGPVDIAREQAIDRERMRRAWGGGWPWLFPGTYLLHIGEELGTGDAFPSWAEIFPERSLDGMWYMLINATMLFVMVGAAELASRSRRFRWVGLALAVLVIINGSFHAVASVVAADYCPGVASGVLFWIPLGLATLARARHSVDWQDYARGLAVGISVHALLTLFAWSFSTPL